jgi:hypothetical protein
VVTGRPNNLLLPKDLNGRHTAIITAGRLSSRIGRQVRMPSLRTGLEPRSPCESR